MGAAQPPRSTVRRGGNRRPDVVCRRLPVRATGARHRLGSTAMVTNVPGAELPAAAL